VIYGLTGGGPGNTTELLGMHIYRLGFTLTTWMGRAAANAVVLVLIVTPLITIMSRVISRRRTEVD